MATGYTLWGTYQKQATWASGVIIEAIKESPIMRFAGEGPNNIIERKHEIQKLRGEKIYFDLFLEMSNAPVTGNNELTGNEETLVSYTDDVLLDRTRNAFKKYGDLEDMKSQKDLKAIGKDILKQYFAQLMNSYSIRWLEGDSSLVWPEAVPATSTTRRSWGGDATGDDKTGSSDIASGDWLGCNEVVRAHYKAMLCDPKFRKLEIEGGKYFIMLMHPRQAYTLKLDSTFLSAQRDARERGKENPVFTGALGSYMGMLLYEDENLWTNSSNDEACAIICGQQAMMMAMGKGPKATYEVSDHENRHSIGIDLIWGLRKSVFNSVDFSVMTMVTYATAPTGAAHS